MNSEERRAARRARRDAEREARRRERAKECTLEAVADFGSLYNAANDAASGVRWKSTVQRYMARVVPNAIKARRDLLEGRDFKRGFVNFDLYERGKLRHISAVHFSERVIQKSISKNALVPAIAPSLTPGCTANVKGRGTDYAISRLKRQLASHYRRFGDSGYVLQVDFSDYFANIDHDACKRLVARYIYDERLLAVMNDQIDAQGVRGLGLGSEPNQILAVALPSPIDRMAESTPGIEASGRYMDDSYLIAQDKALLWRALAEIEGECKKLGIVINSKKTRITKLTRGFIFLKKRFSYGENGKVVVRPSKAAVTRERRKLKRQKRLLDNGDMTLDQITQSYQSWRGSMKRLDARTTVVNMDALFKRLFG